MILILAIKEFNRVLFKMALLDLERMRLLTLAVKQEEEEENLILDMDKILIETIDFKLTKDLNLEKNKALFRILENFLIINLLLNKTYLY